MTAMFRLKHPRDIVYLDGEKVGEYWNPGDKRNFGDCNFSSPVLNSSLSNVDDFIVRAKNETIFECEGKEYVLDVDKCEMIPDMDTGTTVYKLEAKAERQER